MVETLGLDLGIEDDRMVLSNPVAQEYPLDQHEDRARYEVERARRIAAEQRARDLASDMAVAKERHREQPRASGGDFARCTPATGNPLDSKELATSLVRRAWAVHATDLRVRRPNPRVLHMRIHIS